MIEDIARACRTRGLVAGISGITDFARWRNVGYSLIGLPSDAALLGEALAAVLATARGANAEAPTSIP